MGADVALPVTGGDDFETFSEIDAVFLCRVTTLLRRSWP